MAYIERISLKEARKKAGLKQGYVSKVLGISREYLYKIESGKQIPKVTLAYAMASLYGKHIDQLDFSCH